MKSGLKEESSTMLDEKMLFYDRFAERFDAEMNMYDTKRRLEVIFDELLELDLSGKKLLDAGSGTGWFSCKAASRGANVVSLDVGEKILAQVAKKCESRRVVGSVLDIPFPAESFDIVLSTEVIEHTPDPKRAIREMHRVLKKNGTLILTVPNKIWHPAIVIANLLKVRPYEGYENWVGWLQLRNWTKEIGLELEVMKGIHLFPFIFSATHPLLRCADRAGGVLGPLMLNICIKAAKK